MTFVYFYHYKLIMTYLNTMINFDQQLLIIRLINLYYIYLHFQQINNQLMFDLSF